LTYRRIVAEDGIFLVRGLRNFDAKISAHRKAVVQKYISNFAAKIDDQSYAFERIQVM